jgi:hypothetical protein
VVEAIAPLVDGQSNNKRIFKQLSFKRWLREKKMPLLNGNTAFQSGDLRRWCEQEFDILQWESNKNYILTHNVAGVD